jgi:hypothetical protein
VLHLLGSVTLDELAAISPCKHSSHVERLPLQPVKGQECPRCRADGLENDLEPVTFSRVLSSRKIARVLDLVTSQTGKTLIFSSFLVTIRGCKYIQWKVLPQGLRIS